MKPTFAISRLWFRFALLLIILLGFGLRIQELERQSFWSDEGLSLYRAYLPLGEVLANTIIIDDVVTRDTNPPLYFFLLNLWRRGVGDAAPALRLLGVLVGALAVPLMAVLGTAVYSRLAGVVAALLMAISPFHIWESQVVRNYSLLITLNLLAVYSLSRFILTDTPRQDRRWLLVWLAASLAGIYTHYFGAFIFAYTLLFLLLFGLRRSSLRHLWQQKRFWLGVLALLTLLLPILWLGFTQFRAGRQVDFHPLPLLTVLEHAISAWGVGVEPSLSHLWYRYLPALLLAALGLALLWRRRANAALFTLGYLVVPIGLLLLLSLVNPLYNGARHLLIGLPPFLLLAAMGLALPLAWLGKRPFSTPLRPLLTSLTLLLALLTLSIQAWWLSEQFTNPRLLLDDIRGAAQFLNAVATPDDVIILHDTIIGFVFAYYYEGAAPWQAIPTMGQQRVLPAREALAAVDGRRAWFLVESTPRTGFPRDALWTWADESWLRFSSEQFPSMWLRVRLNGYVPQPDQAGLPANATPLPAAWEQQLQLHGLEMGSPTEGGEPLLTTLYFSAPQAEPGQYTVSLRLLDEAGQTWQRSDGTLWHDYPPADWPAGSVIAYPRLLRLPVGLPPGSYAMALSILGVDGRSLRTDDGHSDQIIGQLTIDAPGQNPALLNEELTRQTANAGPLRLLAYALPDAPVRPGHLAPLDLFWQVRQASARPARVLAQLLDPAQQVTAEWDAPLTRADFPPDAWQRGDILQSKLNLLIPATAVPDPHTLRLTVLDENGRSLSRPITLNSPLAIAAWPLVTELPPLPQPIGALFGDPANIRLAGVDLPETAVRPGEPLPLTLIWQALDAPGVNYAVFVHLVSAAGEIVAQRDGLSVNGFRPSASWRPDEVILDPNDLAIPPDTPPGSYTLWVGLYEPDGGERPLLTLNGQPLPDGRLSLGQITVEAAK